MMIAPIIRYALLPGLRSRFEDLMTSGFQFVAYFMALVYNAVRLLPNNHPYLNYQNMGHFGIRHVIAEAANNLTFNHKNIDQILLFISIISGLVLIALQLSLFLVNLMFQPVFANPIFSFQDLFEIPNQEGNNDIALMMMDMVFGVPGIFQSCVSTGDICSDTNGGQIVGDIGPFEDVSILTPLGQGFPFPIHQAMHTMFGMYSTGLLVVATFIAIYFMVTVVAETAQTGTAFGKRFNKIWAPIRIVVAFGLLIPIGSGVASNPSGGGGGADSGGAANPTGAAGLNAAQYIVMYAAKFGSNFATNGWLRFNQELTDSANEQLIATGERLAATPNIPEIGGLLEFMFVAKTCQTLYEEGQITAGTGAGPTGGSGAINMYAVRGPSTATIGTDAIPIASGTPFSGVSDFVFAAGLEQKSTIILRFGRVDDSYGNELGHVFPFCGELAYEIRRTGNSLNRTDPGTHILQEAYWDFVRDLWHTTLTNIDGQNYPRAYAQRYATEKNTNELLAPSTIKRRIQEDYALDLRTQIEAAADAFENSPRYNVEGELTTRGWAAAAIWYNRVAELNGAMTTAVYNIPLPTRYPYIMEFVQQEKKQSDRGAVAPEKRFDPQIANGTTVPFEKAEDYDFAVAMNEAFEFWAEGDYVSSTHTAPTGNIVIDAINALFGTEGLFNIRNNPNVHPLAQLVSIGRGLVEASIRNLSIAVVGGAGGALAKTLSLGFVGKTLSVFSSFLVTFAMVGLTAGFILFYVVPFLPFIYFTFAVGGWIKGIFEAMVGVPLWALAHIRIDGEGLTGQAAVSGYFLIFEIFLRPILMIFGILASISIFSALVSVLHQIFDLVIQNLSGYDNTDTTSNIQVARSAVDSFFYTVVYTIVVYLMALSSFKLIDLIPNNILRWMGQSVSTFNDQREDAAQALVGKATVGAQQSISAIGGGLQGIAKAGN